MHIDIWIYGARGELNEDLACLRRLHHPAANAVLGPAHRISKGLAISPVPLDLRKANLVEVIVIGTGSYFVNGPAGCVGCHTAPTYLPGGDPFAGQPPKINVAG